MRNIAIAVAILIAGATGASAQQKPAADTAKVDADMAPAQPITPSAVTPTDIVVTVSDLIKSAGLNLWDLSMWFNRSKR